VVVLEREQLPGGQVRVAASVPGRAELGDMVRNQLNECERLGVEIRTGCDADVDTVLSESPDVVVVATGSRPLAPYWVPPPDATSSKGPRFADVSEVLEGNADPAGKVLVIDELGFHQATSVAELLADRGCEVEISTPGMVVGQDLGITLDLENFNIRAFAKGITQSVDLVANGITEGGEVSFLHHPTGGTETRKVDWVVLAVPPAPADELYFALRSTALGSNVHRVGDCVAPRRASAAVIEGDRVGAAL
jgi:hypothetical protein